MKFIRLTPLIITISAGIAVAIVLWSVAALENTFRDSQARLMENQARSMAGEVSRVIRSRIQLIEAVAEDNRETLEAISGEPEDEARIESFRGKLLRYFPHYFGFAVVDGLGRQVPDDLGVIVGAVCRRDMGAFLKKGLTEHFDAPYLPMIHPQSFNYHFDIITRWIDGDGRPGLFFISFHPTEIAQMIRTYQLPNHRLVLVRDDIDNLIEITADGARDVLGEAIHLTDKEMARIAVRVPVSGTRWIAIALPEPHLYFNYEMKIQRQAWLIIAAILAFWLAAMLLGIYINRLRAAGLADLRWAKEEAENASRAKSDFLASMSHELRTPLNAILGFSELIRTQYLGPLGTLAYKDYADDIHASGRHLHTLISDMLDLSAIEVGGLTLNEETIDVSETITECLRLIAPMAKAASVTVQNRLEPSLPALRADSRRVKQIIVNLLSNAVKFTPEAGLVSVTAALRDDGVFSLSVSDNGIGMDAAGLKRAKTRFGKLDSRIKGRQTGTGIGLPLSMELIKAHDGNLIIETEPDVGTTVTINFPAERVNKNTTPDHEG